MNAPDPRPAPATHLAIGSPFAGGILLGRFFLEHEPFHLIGAPKAALPGQLPQEAPWNDSLKEVAGALSVYDGLANTRAMAEAGSEIATKALALEIGGHRDWYLWSRGEALLGLAAQPALMPAERFEEEWYWTSTQAADDPAFAWFQSFDDGGQAWGHKSTGFRVFAVRREPIR